MQKELCNEPWQQTRQVIINKHLLGLLDCSGHRNKGCCFQRATRVREWCSVCARGEDAALCRKAASQRSVRSSTNPIPLTASIYSDEPDTDGINFRFSERWAPEQTWGQHISHYQAETLWCAFAPIARTEFLGLWAGLHLSRWLMLASQSFSRPINPQGRMQQGSRNADYSQPLGDFPTNRLPLLPPQQF